MINFIYYFPCTRLKFIFIYIPLSRGKVCDVFNLGNPVYGISVDPCNDNIFASAGEDGRILIFDTRLDPSNGIMSKP